MRKIVFLFVGVCLVPFVQAAEWHKVASDPDKRHEVDKATVRSVAGGKKTAWTRVVLSPDEARRARYLIAKTFSRYDCAGKSFLPVRRELLSAQLVVVKDEALSNAKETLVRPGTIEEKLLDEVCRASHEDVKRVAEEAAKAALAAKAKEAEKAATSRTVRSARRAAPESESALAVWSYDGASGPANWARTRPEFARCGSGKRQSPIDIEDGVKLDLPPVDFRYAPSALKVTDNGHTIQLSYAPGSRISVAGRDYELRQIDFHKPAEEQINGKRYAMSAHLVHKDAIGRLAIVAVLFEVGVPLPVLQTVWNYLPLQRDDEVAPPNIGVDAADFLPEKRDYFAYMGSLTTPPCSEGVLWIVLKTPVQVSSEQIGVFGRLYSMNARPIQPVNGRLIKESR